MMKEEEEKLLPIEAVPSRSIYARLLWNMCRRLPTVTKRLWHRCNKNEWTDCLLISSTALRNTNEYFFWNLELVAEIPGTLSEVVCRDKEDLTLLFDINDNERTDCLR